MYYAKASHTDRSLILISPFFMCGSGSRRRHDVKRVRGGETEEKRGEDRKGEKIKEVGKRNEKG